MPCGGCSALHGVNPNKKKKKAGNANDAFSKCIGLNVEDVCVD